ncbi:MAG: hypothetical protein ABJ215_02895 [Alphaproteobacteria bacterium]
MHIVRFNDIEWEDRVNIDNWPCRTRTFYRNADSDLRIHLIDYPFGSVEPRHVHAGMHAATVLENHAIVDGVKMEPLDVVLGPSNEPHGPLEYPEGCRLVSAFQGSNVHSEVETLSDEKVYRLILQNDIPWVPQEDGSETKTLVDYGLGHLHVVAMRFAAGTTHKPDFLAAILVEGEASVGDESLGVWDFIYADEGEQRSDINFARDTIILTFSLRETSA